MFGGNEQLRPLLKPVRITEDNLGEGRAATWVVDDILHDALDVPVPLGEIHGAQTCGTLAVLHVRAEHGGGTLPLPTDPAAHEAICCLVRPKEATAFIVFIPQRCCCEA